MSDDKNKTDSMAECVEKVQDSIENLNPVEPVIALPNNMDMQSIDRYMPHATFFKQTYSTTDMPDFTKYCLDHAGDGATCFIDREKFKAVTCLDMGSIKDPGHKYHHADLTLKKTPAYRALLHHSQGDMSQEEAGIYLEDWIDYIGIFDKGAKISGIAGIDAIKNITIDSINSRTTEIDGHSEHLSAMERIEANKGSALPSHFELTCSPYEGLDEITITVRIIVRLRGEKPKIAFIIRSKELIEQKMAENMNDKLVELLGEQYPVYMGTIR